ncbi:MAG: FliH/SctL family protein [Defluviitaleaceae bacterium]|nr:FliH/SctL family protein [Defluviitaleaceae bacterium]
MMLSSKRILKPAMVIFDSENKIVIDTGNSASEAETDDESIEARAKSKEETAQNSAARIIRHAERQAEEIQSNAIRKAAQKQEAIKSAAEAEAARIISEARDTGYNEGMEKAISEGNIIRAEAQQILDDAHTERKQMQENLEPETVGMIINITEKLLGNIASVNPAIITNIVKQGFAAATISGEVTVYVSADDYDLVVENKDELMAQTDGSVKLKITKDLSLNPMDCVIETPFGNIDCSLGQQFESIKSSLTYILNNK